MTDDSEIVRLVASFNASEMALINVLRPQINRSMLEEIAAADFGDDVEEHLAELERIHRTGENPPVAWHPGEVLDLIRSSQPDDPSWRPGGQGERGHLMRAYCCSILLRMAALPENFEYG